MCFGKGKILLDKKSGLGLRFGVVDRFFIEKETLEWYDKKENKRAIS